MPTQDIVGVLIATAVSVISVSVLVYAALAVLMHTRWKLSDQGIELRSVAMLFFRVRVAWDDLEWIVAGDRIVPPYMAMKLDGRYLMGRHVTIARRSGSTRLVRWTPADVDGFLAALGPYLDRRPGWRRTTEGWTRG